MTEIIATAPSAVHQSRWGFHPCSRETDRKLRFLNYVYSLAVQKAAAWKRWNRKAPQNRVAQPRIRDAAGRVVGYAAPIPLKEPAICPVFSRLVTKVVQWHPTKGYDRGGIEWTLPETDTHRVGEAAQLARTPVALPAHVKPLPLSEARIDELVAEAKAWLADC
jgi:hypothetical protein